MWQNEENSILFPNKIPEKGKHLADKKEKDDVFFVQMALSIVFLILVLLAGVTGENTRSKMKETCEVLWNNGISVSQKEYISRVASNVIDNVKIKLDTPMVDSGEIGE